MIPQGAIGPLAGVATSFLWVVTTVCFTEGGKRVGSTVVNSLRLLLALILHGATFYLFHDRYLPSLAPAQWWYLGASGLVGLAICDQCLFQSFLELGPRRAVLVMTTSPLFALGLGAVFLSERVPPLSLAAIALTLSGVVWVVLERRAVGSGTEGGFNLRGIGLAFVAAVAQAGGSLLGKRGIGHGWLPQEQHLDPQSATFVRMIFGALAMMPVVLWYAARRHRPERRELRARRAGRRAGGLVWIAVGSVVGPYLGVWLSFVAFDRLPIGVAQTLCSLTPVLILPVSLWFYRERLSVRAVAGVLIALLGSILLMWENRS